MMLTTHFHLVVMVRKNIAVTHQGQSSCFLSCSRVFDVSLRSNLKLGGEAGREFLIIYK